MDDPAGTAGGLDALKTKNHLIIDDSVLDKLELSILK